MGGDELTFNPLRGMTMYIIYGSWYKCFGIPNDNAYMFAESIFKVSEDVMNKLFGDDELGSVSCAMFSCLVMFYGCFMMCQCPS